MHRGDRPRPSDKEALSRNLGAHHFIDSATEDVAARLNRLGGAQAVLATVTSAKAMTPVIEGLAVRGRLVVVGLDAEPIEVSPLQLIGASRSVVGHAAGASIDSQDTLGFSANGVDDGRAALAVSGPGDNSCEAAIRSTSHLLVCYSAHSE